MKVGVHTLGCKVNQTESEQIQTDLLGYGFDLVDPHETTADYYVLNTCSVTISAEAKGRKLARRFRRDNPDATIVFTGCYAELKGDELEEELPEVDYIVGTQDKGAIPELLVGETDDEVLSPEQSQAEVGFRQRKFVKIQDGCRDWCTFCIIPTIRSTLESTPPDNVIQKLHRLDGEGYREVVLNGVHLGEYGVDLDEDVTLTRFTERLAGEDFDFRIRFSSIEPQDVTERFVQIVADSDRFVNHLHLPLQSGSDRILDRMNRNYTREEFLRRVDWCRDRDEDFALNTDIMVGFPGETEEDFQATLDVMESSLFSRSHVFRYSEREGTTAAKMDNQVHSKVRKDRCKTAIEWGDELQARFAARREGARATVLLEDHEWEGRPVGYTERYLPVAVDTDREPNELVEVTLGEYNGDCFLGEPVEPREAVPG